MAAEAAISTLDLAKSYGRVQALAGLTMSVARGEVFGFLGPNGAGKTTAVKLLLGLARPTSGTATVLGLSAGDREARRRVGYLPELFRYPPYLTAREVMEFHCELIGLARAERDVEINAVLEMVGIAARADDRCGGFSKGMQQRLGLGVALLGRPELVFLDEPTSALDPVGRHDVREIIRSLGARGTTVFLNSHLLSEVEMICRRVAVIDHGRVISVGTMEELLGQRIVRVRVTGLSRPNLPTRFGVMDHDGEWLTVRGLEDAAVPDLVAELVKLGGRIHAVEPMQQTLEDRFLELLQL